MEHDVRSLHASSFGAAADAYAEHRPDYAKTAVRWALEPAPGPRVLDLGAGTGKLTGTLVALGADVIAVEPDPAMLTELRRALPGVACPAGQRRGDPAPRCVRRCRAGRKTSPSRC
ncbi:class I SAM-dependent methyltransferase [Nocardia sp. NPDC127526]|uniref:class I SAM-dependent methyltransferase n=1 Tax=Nocardia sp. NPDC127526 TaxID=3345393 RepID=UPI00363FCA30